MPSTIHLIGIGGTGLSAIARVLLESGYTVQGSDRQNNYFIEGLREAGAQVFVGHNPKNITGADLVIRSSAVPDDNPEVQAAYKAHIPVVKRADFLGQLMGGRMGIAVAGTHGKTTTTAMIAWILTALGLDPTFIIGGISINLGTNAHAGIGEAFVIEADEYDRMFLGLQPKIAVVTNIEHDHPDCFPTPEDFYQAFLEFVNNLTPGGVLVACGDDPGAARLVRAAAELGHPTLSYGRLNTQHTCLAHHLTPNTYGGFTFDVICNSTLRGNTDRRLSLVTISLQVPGEHNVLNALAALAVATQLELPLTETARALSEFKGTGRRFEIRGEASGVTVIDDYAHHPTQIRTTLSAARARFPGRPLWAVWQPHTYTRTRTLLDQFANAFKDADHVLMTDIYAAREAAPSDGFSTRQVVAAIQHDDIHYVPSLSQVAAFLLARLRPGDVLLVLSAGDADQISTQVLSALERNHKNVQKNSA